MEIPLLTSKLWISRWPTVSWVDRAGLMRISCPAGPKRTTACGIANFKGADTDVGAPMCSKKKQGERIRNRKEEDKENLQIPTHLCERWEEVHSARLH